MCRDRVKEVHALMELNMTINVLIKRASIGTLASKVTAKKISNK